MRAVSKFARGNFNQNDFHSTIKLRENTSYPIFQLLIIILLKSIIDQITCHIRIILKHFKKHDIIHMIVSDE